MARDRKRAKQRKRKREQEGQPEADPKLEQEGIEEDLPDAPVGSSAAPGILPDAISLDPYENAVSGAPTDETREIHRIEAGLDELAAEEAGGKSGVFEDELESESERQAERDIAHGETPHKRNFLVRFWHFLGDSWSELRRVQWPNRKQVAQGTGIVLVFVFAAGLYLGALDYLFQRLINFII